MISKAGSALHGRKPDVLACIANLSNDEVKALHRDIGAE